MRGIDYTVIADGSSDRVLDCAIRWVLARFGVPVDSGEFAQVPRSCSLFQRARLAIRQHPADILFIHRDAERETHDTRITEIRAAVSGLGTSSVAIVPVRMTEAWLLHDEFAIRCASDNPNGKVALALPAVKDIEHIPDPKAVLHAALLDASEFTGRRREKRKGEFARRRIRTAELIVDFSPLHILPAFQAFFDEVRVALVGLGRVDPD